MIFKAQAQPEKMHSLLLDEPRKSWPRRRLGGKKEQNAAPTLSDPSVAWKLLFHKNSLIKINNNKTC